MQTLPMSPNTPVSPLFVLCIRRYKKHNIRLRLAIWREGQINKLAALLKTNLKHGLAFPVLGAQSKPAKPHFAANDRNNIASPFPMFWLSHLRNLAQLHRV